MTAAWIALRAALRLALPAPGGADLWVGTSPGRAAECGWWAALGVLLAALGDLARRHARGAGAERAAGFARVGGLLFALLALAALRLGLEAAARLVPGPGWLAVEPAALAAGTGIPIALVLGLEGRTGVEAAHSLARRAGQGPAWLRHRLHRLLAATFERR